MQRKWDLPALFLILALGAISLLVIFSISRNLATNQLIFWIIGLAVLSATSLFPYNNWQRLSVPFYIFVLICLFLLFFIGQPIRGSIRWIDLGPFRFQPSELAKIASIFLLANFYSERSARQLKNLITSFAIILPAIVLIFFEPDLGNSLALIAIWFGISLVSGFKLKTIGVFVLAALIFTFFGYELLSGYQKDRIATFINPAKDPLGTGYNIIQSKIAIGSGQFFGRGLGHGSQSQLKFLPEAESDFIFASIAEQLGFLGAVLIVLLQGSLILRIIGFLQNAEKFGRLVIIGAVSFLLLQFMVNVGMNMGLLPVTGITLPLVSYGGSSLISTLFLLGIVFSVKRYQY
ncbi:MAG: rod shape-determining protein RodA [Candidatus Curtissbacteria bacterium]|nr:rod shape-determining protein RodA [Candidatus Curtissbacteria bacterium]